MKNKFTYNVYFNDDSSTLEETMENVLVNYIKQILNGNNRNEGNIKA